MKNILFKSVNKSKKDIPFMKNVSLSLYIALALAPYALDASQIGRNPAVPESWSSTTTSSFESDYDAPLCFSHQSKNLDPKTPWMQVENLNPRTWMQTSGAWEKCRNWEEVDSLATAINALPVEQRSKILCLLQTSGAVLKCKTGQEIADLINTIRNRQADRSLTILSWMQNSRAVEKCPTGRDINSLISVIAMSSIDTYQILKILNQMRNLRVLEKCQTGDEIGRLFFTIDALFAREDHQGILKQMKTSRAWKKCQSGDEVRCFLSLLMNLEGPFKNLKESLIKTCLADYGYLKTLLKWHRDRGNGRAEAILNKERDLLNFRNNWKLYVFCHAFYASNNEVKKATQHMILNDPHPEDLSERIADLVGENHEFSRWCSEVFRKRRQDEGVRE